MNWEAIGAVGEILGAATVVATLFYLARQVRHAASVAQSAARQAISQMNVDSWSASLDPQVLSRAATKADAGVELTSDERGTYVRWILMRMRFVENAYYQHGVGLLDAVEWSGYANLIVFLVGPRSPAADAWRGASMAYSPRFVAEVERILSGPVAKGLQTPVAPTIRVLAASEIARIAEIDRAERITQQYKQRGEALELVDVDLDARRWDEPGEASLEERIAQWKRLVDRGGVALGAFAWGRLVGLAIYVRASSEMPASVAVLHVTRSWRRRGVGRALTDEVVRIAREEGVQRLYVSATPTRGTVDFYTSLGFAPLATPNPRLLALEPEDVHMERVL